MYIKIHVICILKLQKKGTYSTIYKPMIHIQVYMERIEIFRK